MERNTAKIIAYIAIILCYCASCFMLRGKAGFTLVEFIAVVSIIIILSGVSLSMYYQQMNRINLSLATQKLADDLRWSRNMALMTIKKDMGGAEAEIPCGYGISFDTSDDDAYIIYAGNDDDTGTNDCSVADKSYNQAPDNDKEVEKVNLPSRIKISNAGDFDIFFEPPNPKTTIIGASPLTITLQVENRNCPDYCKSIVITSSGKIEY